jgi:hypothetical protein
MAKELSMPTDKRLFIAVISTAENIPRDVEVAWTDANVCLEGPYAASTVQDDTIFKFTSAIIDVRYDADVILSLTRKLDVKAVPYLFFVTENLARAVEGPFVLSGQTEDIEAIVAALVNQGAGLKH